MALTKAQKTDVLAKFADIAKSAASMVFIHTKGISVNNTNQLRSQLRNADGGYVVAKKTLFLKALNDASLTGDMPKLSGGELAVAYGSDLIAPAREVFGFKKKFTDNVTVVGGVFDGKYMTAAEMQAIAEIPSPQVLRGMFVNVINSPIQGMVIALSKIAEQKAA
jgi:large subunit ribosomal protein L10